MNTAVAAYRNSIVESSSPVGLVVMLYDTALTSLRRAEDAVKRGDVEQRTSNVNHALDILGHLQATLDMERGGEVSKTLWSFYSYARRQLLAANFERSVPKMAEIEAQIESLRDAWKEVERSVANS